MKEPHACPTRRGEDSCAILHVVNKAAANSVNFTSLNLTNLQGKAALAKKTNNCYNFLRASFLSLVSRSGGCTCLPLVWFVQALRYGIYTSVVVLYVATDTRLPRIQASIRILHLLLRL